MTPRPDRTFGHFDLGLTPADEERARRLHEAATIVDLVHWGPMGPLTFPPDVAARLSKEWEERRDPARVARLASSLPVERCAAGVDDAFRRYWEASGVTAANQQVELGSAEIAVCSFATVQRRFDRLPWLRKALVADDIGTAKRDGVRAGFVNTQLSTGPGADLVRALPALHDLGLRMLMLTYNSTTVIGSGCTERIDGGVTRYGGRVIAAMNRLGVMVDTAHCGPQTTLDACALSERPVVASHATAAGVYPHARGKADDVLEAIAATGGVIGVATVPAFLSPADPTTISDVLDHLDHMVRVVGWEHVAVGTDWPLPVPGPLVAPVFGAAVGDTFRDEDAMDFDRVLIGFEDYQDFPNITRGLVSRGYTDEQALGILGGNALRVMEEVWG